MENERTYTRNASSFRKGMTPHNKGANTTSRVGEFIQKGHQGFKRRPVVAIAPDGTVERRFDGVEQCRMWLGLRDRHSVTRACKGLGKCRGYVLMYEEDWSRFGDYHYRPTPGRDIRGRLQKGHGLSAMFYRRQSEETRETARTRHRETSRRLAHDRASRWGKGAPRKRVRCATTGERFDSIKEASLRCGVPANQISLAIRRRGAAHGLKFTMDIQ